jgi:anti-sigma B factor antagonist
LLFFILTIIWVDVSIGQGDLMENYIKYRQTEKYLVIEFLIQKFDLFETSKLLTHIESILSRDGYKDITVDLKNVMIIDSSGIGTLIALQSRLKKNGKEMVVVCDNDTILKVFKITKMFDFFKVYKNMDEADGYFNSVSKAG